MASTLLAAFAILLLAALAQAVTGFGFALVAVPLLALAADPRSAVVAAGLASLAMNLVVAAREHRHVRWVETGQLLAAGALGMPLGIWLLRAAPERVLGALIAVCVLGCVALVWRDVRLRAPTPLATGGIGVLAGALSTATGTNGPPLVAAFHAMGYDPRTFRATLAAVFAGSGAVGGGGFLLSGLVTPLVAWIALVGLPAIGFGWLIGDRLFRRLSTTRFRTIVLAALVVSCAVTLLRTAVL
jgi:hypothetical protein